MCSKNVGANFVATVTSHDLLNPVPGSEIKMTVPLNSHPSKVCMAVLLELLTPQFHVQFVGYRECKSFCSGKPRLSREDNSLPCRLPFYWQFQLPFCEHSRRMGLVAMDTIGSPRVYFTYPLLTKFEGRTVSYGPSLFPLDLWPKREARGP